ncbi:MAG: hypothetical protein ACXABY_07865 [Candidatus Thorarchaeota archaeon]
MTDQELREIEERAKAAEEGESMEKVCSNCYPVAYDIPKLLSYIRELREGLNHIASWGEGEYWRECSFDEPWSARKAREVLGKFKI